MNLNGVVVWVVGASSGIGAATARELVRRGAKVAISARRETQLREVAGDHMLAVAADVTDPASISAAATTVRNALGPPDLVLYCAAYWVQMDAAHWDRAAFDRHLQVNLSGLSNVLAVAVPAMAERGSGAIAGISSVAGYRGLAGSGGYGATKAAQLNLLESLRIQLAPLGITVTTITPGFVRTELTSGNQFPMPFMIEPAEAATAICDGLQRGKTQIAFPRPMALLMTAARFVPPRLWAAAWSRTGRRPRMRIDRSITVDKPIGAVFRYLSDFTTTTQWDPNTVRTVREGDERGVGAVYVNTSRFLGRTTELRYVVEELTAVEGADAPRRIRLRGENASVVAHDTMALSAVPGGTRVDYTAEFALVGYRRFVAPLLRPAFRRLGDRAEKGLRAALEALPA